MWKYYEGAEKVTSGKIKGVLMFVLHVLVTNIISVAVCQDAYNKIATPAV